MKMEARSQKTEAGMWSGASGSGIPRLPAGAGFRWFKNLEAGRMKSESEGRRAQLLQMPRYSDFCLLTSVFLPSSGAL
jgi:hypothetical protein